MDNFVDGNILILFRLASSRQAELELKITVYVIFWFHSPNYVIPPPPPHTHIHTPQWFLRGVDGEIDLFWVSGQSFLFNLSKYITPNFILYQCHISRILEVPVLKMNPKLIAYNT